MEEDQRVPGAGGEQLSLCCRDLCPQVEGIGSQVSLLFGGRTAASLHARLEHVMRGIHDLGLCLPEASLEVASFLLLVNGFHQQQQTYIMYAM